MTTKLRRPLKRWIEADPLRDQDGKCAMCGREVVLVVHRRLGKNDYACIGCQAQRAGFCTCEPLPLPDEADKTDPEDR